MSHEHSLDNKVLFIPAFWNRNNTVTNNTVTPTDMLFFFPHVLCVTWFLSLVNLCHYVQLSLIIMFIYIPHISCFLFSVSSSGLLDIFVCLLPSNYGLTLSGLLKTVYHYSSSSCFSPAPHHDRRPHINKELKRRVSPCFVFCPFFSTSLLLMLEQRSLSLVDQTRLFVEIDNFWPCAPGSTMGKFYFLGSLVPGRRLIAQSHGRCGGRFVAATLLKTSWNARYSSGRLTLEAISGLSIVVDPKMAVLWGGTGRDRRQCWRQ